MGEENVSKIVFVRSDKPCKLIREQRSRSLQILDRFQIVAKTIKALDEVRAEESRRIRQRRSRSGPEKVPLVAAQARRESRRGAALPASRSARYRVYLFKNTFSISSIN